jgi:hypothetical protein
MKSLIRITGVVLMFAASTFSSDAQRGMRGMPDSTRINRPGREMGMMRMMTPPMKGDSLFMKRMQRDYMANQFRGGMRGMGPGQGFMMHPGDRYGMRGMRNFQGGRNGMRGMREFPGDRFGTRPPFHEMMRIESLPGLTDKQRTDIAALREKQQAEMKKLREEFTTKMAALREDQKKKIAGLLTDEQKKLLKSKPGFDGPQFRSK